MATAKRLVPGSQLTTSAATYYTAPAATTARITAFTITNTSAGAVTASVHLVPSAGTADDTNIIADVLPLSANQTQTLTAAIGHVIETGGTIQALASAGTSVNIVVSGVEIV
jgi:predicted phage tail protein